MIGVIDFGSQYTHLICRRIRELGARSYIWPFNADINFPEDLAGIILSGSPSSAVTDNSPKPPEEIFSMGLPVLGICYGMQVMAGMLGGSLEPGTGGEYGSASVALGGGLLFRRLPSSIRAWMSHYDRVKKLPGGFKVTALSGAEPAAIEDPSRNFYGLQFHPEVSHTEKGTEILDNFIDICRDPRDWELLSWAEEEIGRIKKEAAGGRVIMALSGGVDSTVAAVIIKRALGDRFYPVFVDHGLTRFKDIARINKTVKSRMGINVRVVEASERFFRALKGVRDPEKKRKIIGREFISIFQEEASRIGGVTHLAQGTLYPDVIESASSGTGSANIKSHHNVGGLPEKMNLKLIEPFRELYKDEVRRIGANEGVPAEILNQHPFPGPGLAVRIVGEVNRKRAGILRRADVILEEELKKAGVYYGLWQAFPVYLPVRSVGVMGDGRTYGNVIALRCVESSDAMTASWACLPYGVLSAVSTRIVNEIRGINRVVYDITNKPPGTIEWE